MAARAKNIEKKNKQKKNKKKKQTKRQTATTKNKPLNDISSLASVPI